MEDALSLYDIIDTGKCFKCEERLDETVLNIECKKCTRWFHQKCTDMDWNEMSDIEVEDFPFECSYC